MSIAKKESSYVLEMVHVCHLLQYLGKYFKVLTCKQYCEQHMRNKMRHEDRAISCKRECPHTNVHDEKAE